MHLPKNQDLNNYIYYLYEILAFEYLFNDLFCLDKRNLFINNIQNFENNSIDTVLFNNKFLYEINSGELFSNNPSINKKCSYDIKG